MNTYEERVELIFRFIEEDIEGLAAHKHGTFRDLQKELATFAEVAPREFTLDVFIELRRVLVHEIIWPIAAHNFKEARGGSLEERPAKYTFPASAEGAAIEWIYRDGHFTPSLPATALIATIEASTPANRFLWEICVTFSQVGASRIRICHREGCGRYFFADHGNQFYCTQQCGNKARIKRYRSPAPDTEKKAPKRTKKTATSLA